MLNKYFKYKNKYFKNKYLSGGSLYISNITELPSNNRIVPLTLDIINMNGELVVDTIYFSKYITIKEVKEYINSLYENIAYELVLELENDILNDDYQLTNNTILRLIMKTTLFNILDYKLKNNDLIIEDYFSDNLCHLTFKFDLIINLYIKSKDNLTNIYLNNINYIKIVNKIYTRGKRFTLLFRDRNDSESVFENFNEETINIFNEEINEYDLTNYWNDDYYEIKLGKNYISFFMPNTEKTNKENRECNTRIYDNDFIKFLNKFYVEYVN